jgi:hypothetical protein
MKKGHRLGDDGPLFPFGCTGTASRLPLCSQELHSTCHLPRTEQFVDQTQCFNNLPGSASVLATIGDPRMLNALAMPTQIVRVVRDDHALFLMSVLKLGRIIGTDQTSFLSGGHINAVLAQRNCNGESHMLV